MKTKFIASLFALAVVAQLWVPASMISSSEKTLDSGRAFKFSTAPVDPYDAFRGKYVALNFTASTIDRKLCAADISEESGHLERGQSVYAIIAEDTSGFAKIALVQKSQPDQGFYVKTEIRYHTDSVIDVQFPFTKYFLGEEKAQKAEELYRQNNRTDNQDCYAIVRVGSKGNAIIEDLVLGGIPIKEAVR